MKKQIWKSLVVGVLVLFAVSGQNLSPQQDFAAPIATEKQRWFATMDTQRKEEYQEERYRDILAGLSETSFKAANQELLAQALSKTYVGVPVCTYVYSHESQGELFKDVDDVGDLSMSGQWTVLSRGTQDFRSEMPEGFQFRTKPLSNPMSPFVYIPAIPFSLSDGRVLKETPSLMTFSFPLDTLLFKHSHRRIEWLAKQADWVVEFTVDKERQAPNTLKFRLSEPVKKPMRHSFNAVDINMKFNYLENCEFYARTSLTVRIEGSAITQGKFVEEMSDSYTDIECERPLVYLRPHKPRVSFLDHIFW